MRTEIVSEGHNFSTWVKKTNIHIANFSYFGKLFLLTSSVDASFSHWETEMLTHRHTGRKDNLGRQLEDKLTEIRGMRGKTKIKRSVQQKLQVIRSNDGGILFGGIRIARLFDILKKVFWKWVCSFYPKRSGS